MASKPYPDCRKNRGVWLMKYRPDPTGDWVVVNLGKDPRLKPGVNADKLKPPQVVVDRARQFAEREYRAKHGIAVGPARAKPLRPYVENYLETFEATHKTNSNRMARRIAEKFLEFAEGKGATTVQGVTRSICRDYLEFRIKVVSHDTCETEMRYLAPIWTRALEDELVVKNPWSKLPVPGKSTRSEPVFWTSEEVAKIAAHCPKAWQSDLVLLLASTGLRIRTALALRWEWITWRTGVIEIPRAVAVEQDGIKTAYRVGMTGTAREILERRQFTAKGDELVFTNPLRGGPIGYDTARTAIMTAIKRANVKPGTPHDLRHTYGRLLDRSGLPSSIVQGQLGHSSPNTTKIYTDATAEEAARYLEGFKVGSPATPPATDHDPDPSQPPA